MATMKSTFFWVVLPKYTKTQQRRTYSSNTTFPRNCLLLVEAGSHWRKVKTIYRMNKQSVLKLRCSLLLHTLKRKPDLQVYHFKCGHILQGAVVNSTTLKE